MTDIYTTKPFRSQAQWRQCFAKDDPRWDCSTWAHETPGGEGERFRDLPRTKRREKVRAQRKERAALKANYGARAGETIAGNLKRGTDGKFSSAGGAPAPKKPKKKRQQRLAKKPKKRAQSASSGSSQASPDRTQEQQAQRDANRKKVAEALNIPQNVMDALLEFASPDENIQLSDANAAALEALGLVERAEDGSYRMTGAGSTVANAANSGNVRRAADALSRGRDRRSRRQQRNEQRASRRQDRQRRDQERATARQEQQEPRGGGGGGKSGSGGPTAAQRARQERTRQAQEQRRRALDERISGLLGRGKSFTVYKDARGQWRWVGITTTAYEDRDNEIISTKALQADVARADADGRYGPLRWWHLGQPDPTDPAAPWGPGVDLGMCDYNAVCGRTLIESGTFADPRIGAAIAAKAADLAFSPGFFHPPGEPDTSGVFHHIRRFERSLAPRGNVSNRFTSLVVAKETRRMDEQKLKQLVDLLGSPELAQQVISAAQTTQKTAEAEGVRYKTEQAQTLTLGGIEYTLVPVEKAPPPPPAEEEPAAATEEMAEPPMAESNGADDALLTPAEVQAIAAAVVEAMAPLLTELSTKMDIEKKIAAPPGDQDATRDAGHTATFTPVTMSRQQPLFSSYTTFCVRVVSPSSIIFKMRSTVQTERIVRRRSLFATGARTTAAPPVPRSSSCKSSSSQNATCPCSVATLIRKC